MGKTRRHGAGRGEAARPVAKIKEHEVIRKVEDLVSPVIAADGMELVLVEYQREQGGRVMRLYIDKPGGVTLDDCVSVNRHIGDLLDVGLDDIGPYRLEVSSPGADRPLAKPADYERFAGERVAIKLKSPLEGRKNIKGRLAGTEAEAAVVETDTGTLHVPIDAIAKAKLDPRLKP